MRHRAVLDECLAVKGGVVVGFAPQHFVMDGSVCAGNDVNGLGFCCSGHLVHDGKWDQVCPAITLATGSALTSDISEHTLSDITSATATTTTTTASDAMTSTIIIDAIDTPDYNTVDTFATPEMSADTPAPLEMAAGTLIPLEISTDAVAPPEISTDAGALAPPHKPHSGVTDCTSTAKVAEVDDVMTVFDSEGHQHVGVSVGLLTSFSPTSRCVRVAITHNGHIVAVRNVIKMYKDRPTTHVKKDVDMYPVLSFGKISHICTPSVSVHLRAKDVLRAPRQSNSLFWRTGSLLALDGEIVGVDEL